MKGGEVGTKLLGKSRKEQEEINGSSSIERVAGGGRIKFRCLE